MKNKLFYLITVLIWGSTWLGIKLQLGVVEPMVSVVYRFGLAALILLIWCWVKRMNMRFGWREHGFMLLQGVLLFGFNYLLFYEAELLVTSGLAAVIFSTILAMNIINGAIFLGSAVDKKVVIGGILGLIGIVLVFRPEISSFSFDNNGMKGIILCIFATLLASLGNITSARNQKNKLPIIQSNAYDMAYGALILFIVSLASGKAFIFDYSFVYIGSLLYLAIFGSIIAFGCYLSLVGSIGADRAAYATLLFPLVALLISTIWENYQWTISSLTGVCLILLGNFIILQKQKGSKLNPMRALQSKW
ncbi:MAG: DMT family transporter [Deltaproteobacteria bacterium]|nr:DMT family transporter [Deltaproteobacteria bacterium]